MLESSWNLFLSLSKIWLFNTYKAGCKQDWFRLSSPRSTNAKNIFDKKAVYKNRLWGTRDWTCAMYPRDCNNVIKSNNIAQVRSRAPKVDFYIQLFLSKDIFCVCRSRRAESKSVLLTTSLVSVNSFAEECVINLKMYGIKASTLPTFLLSTLPIILI